MLSVEGGSALSGKPPAAHARGEDKAPCLCGIHRLSPRELAFLISPAEASELPSQSFIQ